MTHINQRLAFCQVEKNTEAPVFTMIPKFLSEMDIEAD
jgi:hypothetical protein